MRVCAMDVQKYKDDLILIKEYYYSHFTNKEFHCEAKTHALSYKKIVVLFGVESMKSSFQTAQKF
jgi:hypothetical protein